MRFVVYGAGGIGGVIGGRLFQHGHEVALIARGEHARVLRRDGLRLESADEVDTLAIPTFEGPAEAGVGPDDVVVLAMKTQDAGAALDELVASTPGGPAAVVCAQNGVENERLALRRFADVYGMCVMCPTSHLEPGVVQAVSSPITGILDVGPFPGGVGPGASPGGDGAGEDSMASDIAAALADSTFVSVPRPDIMRWKYAKLLMNLGNVVEAAFGSAPAAADLSRRARHEGRDCLEAAGIDVASAAEDRERRGDLLQIRPIRGEMRGGGSTWQSVARGAARLETDYLNGEIALIGRRHGTPTPVNDALQRLGWHLSGGGTAPGSADLDAFLAGLDQSVGATDA